MNQSEKILKRILEVGGHPYFSEHGVSEAFIRTRISMYSQKWDAVYDDFLFDLVEKIETKDGYIKSIVSKK